MKPIRTRVAHAGYGEHRYFGHPVLSGLLGAETCTGLIAIAVMGRRPTLDERCTLDALAVSLTAGDPRIWPLKVARIAASYGEVLAGFAAGQLAMMGRGISPRIIGDAAEHLQALRVALEGVSAEGVDEVIRRHVSAQPRLAGYGIPLRERDERFEALRGWLMPGSRGVLPHWQTQETLSEWLLRERRLAPNIGIGLAAALLDMECTPVQAGALSTFLIEHVLAANAFEAAVQSEASMLRALPQDCVHYVGASPRTSPRALAEEIERASRASSRRP